MQCLFIVKMATLVEMFEFFLVVVVDTFEQKSVFKNYKIELEHNSKSNGGDT